VRYGKAGRGTLPGVRGETQRSAVEVDASGGEARGRYSATTGGHVAPPGASAAPHALLHADSALPVGSALATT
jgi:hypothetical protein